MGGWLVAFFVFPSLRPPEVSVSGAANMPALLPACAPPPLRRQHADELANLDLAALVSVAAADEEARKRLERLAGSAVDKGVFEAKRGLIHEWIEAGASARGYNFGGRGQCGGLLERREGQGSLFSLPGLAWLAATVAPSPSPCPQATRACCRRRCS